jgi:DNA-directed RNA polymerase sigma subunit (sigma70/sigma32)
MQKEESFTSVFDQVLEDKKREKIEMVKKPQQIDDVIDSDSDDEHKDFLVDEEETRKEEPIPSVDSIEDIERLVESIKEKPTEVKQESKMAFLCRYFFSFGK